MQPRTDGFNYLFIINFPLFFAWWQSGCRLAIPIIILYDYECMIQEQNLFLFSKSPFQNRLIAVFFWFECLRHFECMDSVSGNFPSHSPKRTHSNPKKSPEMLSLKYISIYDCFFGDGAARKSFQTTNPSFPCAFPYLAEHSKRNDPEFHHLNTFTQN